MKFTFRKRAFLNPVTTNQTSYILAHVKTLNMARIRSVLTSSHWPIASAQFSLNSFSVARGIDVLA